MHMKCGILITEHCFKRHCTDHEIYYKRIELNLRKFSNGPFSETEKGFGVGPTQLEVANIQGFHPLFHEIDLAPLFHSLSGSKWCLEMP